MLVEYTGIASVAHKIAAILNRHKARRAAGLSFGIVRNTTRKLLEMEIQCCS
jgi:hypothetical protein